jgi:uncharacterized membrane protein YgcG
MRAGPEHELDRILSGRGRASDRNLESLAELATKLNASFTAPAPRGAGQRCLFVASVASHRPRLRPTRLVAPVVAAAALVGCLAILSRHSLPGDALYPVRQVLGSVGLAPTTSEAADTRIQAARALIQQARTDLGLHSFRAAHDEAVRAIFDLGRARALVRGLGRHDRAVRIAEINSLRRAAAEILDAAHPAAVARTVPPGPGGAGSPSHPTRRPGAGTGQTDSGRHSGKRTGNGPGRHPNPTASHHRRSHHKGRGHSHKGGHPSEQGSSHRSHRSKHGGATPSPDPNGGSSGSGGDKSKSSNGNSSDHDPSGSGHSATARR